MITISSMNVHSLLSYDKLSKKPILFKSFTGLTVQEFDEIYKKEITKRYQKHKIKRLSKRKDRERERKFGAGRPFKLDVRDRFLMLLVYYRLYITYTLTGFLFDLDQSNVCRDIQKIESMIRQCVPIPQKIYGITKRLQTPQKKSKNISMPSVFHRFHRTTDTIKTVDKEKKKVNYLRQEEKTYCQRISLWLTVM